MNGCSERLVPVIEKYEDTCCAHLERAEAILAWIGAAWELLKQ